MKSLGFTFDEKILRNTSIEAFFDEIPSIDSMEIAPDERILSILTYKKLVGKLPSHNFHVPYFVKEKAYDFSNEDYKKDYIKFLSIIESLRQYSVKRPSIVLHGSSHAQTATEQTKKGLDFLLNFVEQKKIDVTLTLETLPPTPAFGSRDQILQIINEFDHPKLKICLDLCHDYYNFDPYELPNKAFLEQVQYIHIHGNGTEKHQSIQKFPVDILQSLQLDVTYNLELLTQFCETYQKTVISDIRYLQKHL